MTNAELKEMADNTGIKYKNLKDLRKNADKFFELKSMVEQYLRELRELDEAGAYDDEQMGEAVNVCVQLDNVPPGTRLSLDQMILVMTQELEEIKKRRESLFDGFNPDDLDWVILE